VKELSALHDVRKIDYVILNAGILEYPNVRQPQLCWGIPLILAEGD